MGKRARREESEEEQFSVEVILQAEWAYPPGDEDEQGRKLGWQYLVHWHGYDKNSDSWEPEENLKDSCTRLISEFWKDVGRPSKLKEGWVSRPASDAFIAREKKYFMDEKRREEAEEAEKKKRRAAKRAKKAEEKAEAEEKAANATKQGSNGRSSSRVSTHGDEEEAPPQNLKKKRRAVDVQIDSDDDDDVPLSQLQKTSLAKSAASTSISAMNRTDDVQSAAASRPVTTDESTSIPTPAKPTQLRINTGSASRATVVGTAGTIIPRKRKASPLFSEDEADFGDEVVTSPEVPIQKMTMSNRGDTSTKVTTSSTPADRNHASQPSSNRQTLSSEAPTTGQGSSLATKQRLAQEAVQLQPPKSKFKGLSFKKTPASQTAAAPSSSSTHIIPPGTTSAQFHPGGNVIFDTIDWVASPQTMEAPGLPSVNPRDNAASIPRDLLEEADGFLNEIMPAGMAAPLESAPDNESLPPKPVQKPSAKSFSFTKKWKWTGQLYFDVRPDHAESLCEAMITDTMNSTEGQGLRFSLVLSENVHSLRFRRMFDLTYFANICNALTKAQDCAVVRANEAKDKAAFEHFTKYLRLHEKILTAPARIGDQGEEKGLLVVFSSGHDIRGRLGIMTAPPGDAELLIAVLQWQVSPSLYARRIWRTNGALAPIPPKLDVKDLPKVSKSDIRSSPTYYRALRILKMPVHLHLTMSKRSETFCIWPPHAFRDDPETLALRLVLSRCGAKDAGHKADVVAFFIHLAALSSVQDIPALSVRREKRYDMRFYTYGTHPDVRPDRWGVREIWSLGGVVTFTPSAIFQNPFKVVSFIATVNKHPLWTCYLLPSVVGAVAKLSCPGDLDAVSLLQTGGFLYADLLALIQNGEISVLSHPPTSLCDPDLPDRKAWADWQIEAGMSDTTELLKLCLQTFNSAYGNVDSDQLHGLLHAAIKKDLAEMQIQPAIMDQYRRFVVIKDEGEQLESAHGIECMSQNDFRFKDELDSTLKSEPIRPTIGWL